MDAYEDVPGFCKSLSIEKIREHGYVLASGRYLGAAEIEEDSIPFEEKMFELSARLYEQFTESDRLEATIKKNLEGLGYGGMTQLNKMPVLFNNVRAYLTIDKYGEAGL